MVVAAVVCAGVLAGALLVRLAYERELRRQARFLESREPGSNARMRVRLPGGGWRALACAINLQLEAVQEEALGSLRRQQEFRRDLSALGHDMKTPLAGARGYLQLAELAARAGRDAEASAYLASAAERIDATGRLLDRLSAYVRANDPDRTYSCESVRLLPFLVDVLTGYVPELAARGWEPQIRFADEGLSVMADPTALRRVLDNLVSNALRHGASTVSFVQEGGARGWRLRVSNRLGEGALVEVDRVFDRFWRSDPARSAPGMGLGLAIAHRLAEDMGMELTCAVADDVITFTLAGGGTVSRPGSDGPGFA